MTNRPFKPKTKAARANERNKTRAYQGELAVVRVKCSGPGPFGHMCYEPEHLVDLLTNLMHLCDRRLALDFDQALDAARRHFAAETDLLAEEVA